MKMLNYTKKIVKFGQILRLKHKKRLFFSQNFDIFSQNLVSGPHKRHDGGQNFLIFQRIWKKRTPEVKISEKTPPFAEKNSKTPPRGENFGKKTPPEVIILVKNGPPR